MKLDKFGKTWAKIMGVVLMTCSAYLIGGLDSPWVAEAPIEAKIWSTAFIVIMALVALALAFLTEAKEKSINPNESRKES